MVNNKDNRVFMCDHSSLSECLCLGTIDLIVAPWKFDVLKTSAGQLSYDSSSTETFFYSNNKPFLSCCYLFQSKSWRTTFHMKMRFFCTFIVLKNTHFHMNGWAPCFV